MIMKKILAIIGLLALSTQAFSQTKEKQQLLVNEAEKKAVNLMKPIDFSQQIIDAIKFPSDFSTALGPFRLMLEKSIQQKRIILMNKFLSGTFSYTDAFNFVDSVKTAYINHIKEGVATGKCKALALQLRFRQ